MPKLYYHPQTCGAASFIAAFAGKVNIETEHVDVRTHLTASGLDFYTINPKGNVPTLVLDNGAILHESASVLQYIADLVSHLLALQSFDSLIIHHSFRLLQDSSHLQMDLRTDFTSRMR
jgi:glutathione S-transferase